MEGKILKTEILKRLKNRFIELFPNKINDTFFVDKKGSNSSYYVRPSYINNLYLGEEFEKTYKKLFLKASGHELTKYKRWGNICKMQSLGSSSAMIVNLIGQKQGSKLKIKENKFGIPSGFYDVAFEKKFRILKGKDGEIPPNVDGFMLSSDKQTAILIETKMLEYLTSKPEITKKKYMIPNNYYCNGENFVKCFKKADKAFKNTTLDYQQLIKHVIGFYNAIVKPKECFNIYDFNCEDLSKVKNVILLNVVWRIVDEKNYLFNDFKGFWAVESENDENLLQLSNTISEAVNGYFNNLSIKFLSFNQFIDSVDMSKEHKSYLRRYYI